MRLVRRLNYVIKKKKVEDKIIALAVIFFFLIITIPFIIRSEFLYARNLHVAGVVSSIEWESSNHQLPKFILLDESGKEITISHFSIALNDSNVKKGDKLIKENGNNYCMINGKKVGFSIYLGVDSIFEIFRFVFRGRSKK